MIAPARHRRGGFFVAGFAMAHTGKTSSDGSDSRSRPGSTRRKRSSTATGATDRSPTPARKTSRRRSAASSAGAVPPPPRSGTDVLAALAADFAQHGPTVIAAIRAEKPVEYLKLLASLLPKEPPLPPPVPDPIDGLTDDELTACIAELRAQIAADRQPAGAQPDGSEGSGTNEPEPVGALPAVS
ncbi:MAG TPA: hypothetical protein VGD08_19335 [Stellaceae bacterium]